MRNSGHVDKYYQSHFPISTHYFRQTWEIDPHPIPEITHTVFVICLDFLPLRIK